MVIPSWKTLFITACLAPVLSFSQQGASKPQAQAEVFLLAPHVHYTYDYYYSESFRDELTSSTRIDSGVVEYVVVDSVQVNDTIARWQVREYAVLLRKETASLCPCETTYIAADSVTISLYEHTSGMHALECAGIAWQLPIHPGASPMNRYADSSEVMMVRSSSGPGGSAFDSLRLSATSGLSFRESSSRSSSGFIVSSHYTRFQLRGAPSSAPLDAPAMPAHAELLQNYPNPFNPSTNITYAVAIEGYVSLVVYDPLGREVASLVRETKQPGWYNVTWHAEQLPSGIYFCRLSNGPHGETKKMILMR